MKKFIKLVFDVRVRERKVGKRKHSQVAGLNICVDSGAISFDWKNRGGLIDTGERYIAESFFRHIKF